ncbi:MAG: hypothetical protein ACWA49_03460 [Ruegeria sp.]
MRGRERLPARDMALAGMAQERSPGAGRLPARGLTAQYVDAKRQNLHVDGSATPSDGRGLRWAWSRALTMLTYEPLADTLTPDILASIGLDLCLRGESVWHIRVHAIEPELVPVTLWGELGGGKYHLHNAKLPDCCRAYKKDEGRPERRPLTFYNL